jgi:hypothetical protein
MGGPHLAQSAYSKIAVFIDKLVAETVAGRVTEFIVLTSNATDATWFQKASAWSSALCLPARRIKFVSPHGLASGPAQGQALFYRGPHVGKFAELFAPIGRIVAGGVIILDDPA